MKLRNTFALLVVCNSLAFSQDFSNYYSYLLNKVNINSAFAGNQNRFEAVLDSRSQLTGVAGSPKNIMFGINGPVFANQGAGLKMIFDTRGVFDVAKVEAMYSHRFYLQEKTYLRLGLSAGVLNRRINTSNLKADNTGFDLSDPTLNDQNFNTNSFVSGFGLLFDWKNLELGFSAPQIVEGGQEISNHLVGLASYDLALNTKWVLQPTVFYQNMPATQNILDAMVKAEWNKKLSVVVAYANNNRLKAGAGFNLSGFGLNYMYEYSTGALNSLSANTHEILLTASIKKKTRPVDAKAGKELDVMISYISNLIKDESRYSKEFLNHEIQKINKQLDEIMADKSNKNSAEVADKLQRIEQQIDVLLEKYNSK